MNYKLLFWQCLCLILIVIIFYILYNMKTQIIDFNEIVCQNCINEWILKNNEAFRLPWLNE